MIDSGSRELRPLRASDLFSREEIKALARPSNLAGAATVFGLWAGVAAAFALPALAPHPLTFAAAVVVLGGRQLALAVAMHEAAHGTLFRTRFLNDIVADFLCARPVFGDVARYRRHHVRHHAHTGTGRDPDLGLAPIAPMARASIARKFARDLFGISGARRVVGVALVDLELFEYDVGGGVPKRLPFRGVVAHARAFAKNAGPALAANAALASALGLLGCGWAYLAWVVAYLTTYGLFLRVRSLAEHACTERGRDPLRNTRSTRAGLLARLTVAPLNVNWHLEHHLLPTVPWYRLPAMARKLAEAGALPEGSVAGSYREVLAIVSRG